MNLSDKSQCISNTEPQCHSTMMKQTAMRGVPCQIIKNGFGNCINEDYEPIHRINL